MTWLMSIPKENARVLETDPHTTDSPAPAPVARSPLAPAGVPEVIDGWEYSTGAAAGPVVVSDRSATSKIHIQVDTSAAVIAALGTRFGRAVWRDDRLVIGSGPDEWLVLAAPGRARVVAEEHARDLRVAYPGLVTVIDVTHGRALMRVSGPRTMSLLRRVTAVDLDDRLVPHGSALRTSVAGVVSDLIRDDLAGSPAYLLHCERSSGRYLQQSLLAAGADLGVVPGSSGPAWPDHAGV
jgi:heterotetrameric sarcosine oxidase gamma subunit